MSNSRIHLLEPSVGLARAHFIQEAVERAHDALTAAGWRPRFDDFIFRACALHEDQLTPESLAEALINDAGLCYWWSAGGKFTVEPFSGRDLAGALIQLATADLESALEARA